MMQNIPTRKEVVHIAQAENGTYTIVTTQFDADDNFQGSQESDNAIESIEEARENLAQAIDGATDSGVWEVVAKGADTVTIAFNEEAANALKAEAWGDDV